MQRSYGDSARGAGSQFKGASSWPSTTPQRVYEYLRTLGDPGDEVMTSIRPWLEKAYGLGYPHAPRIRRIAMNELTAQGKVERFNTRGRYVRILA